jgi:hypothetical protein
VHLFDTTGPSEPGPSVIESNPGTVDVGEGPAKSWGVRHAPTAGGLYDEPPFVLRRPRLVGDTARHLATDDLGRCWWSMLPGGRSLEIKKRGGARCRCHGRRRRRVGAPDVVVTGRRGQDTPSGRSARAARRKSFALGEGTWVYRLDANGGERGVETLRLLGVTVGNQTPHRHAGVERMSRAVAPLLGVTREAVGSTVPPSRCTSLVDLDHDERVEAPQDDRVDRNASAVKMTRLGRGRIRSR